jgi:hypothetical protein
MAEIQVDPIDMDRFLDPILLSGAVHRIDLQRPAPRRRLRADEERIRQQQNGQDHPNTPVGFAQSHSPLGQLDHKHSHHNPIPKVHEEQAKDARQSSKEQINKLRR